MNKALLVTLDFPPNHGGVAAYYGNVCGHLPPDQIVVLAPDGKGSEYFDARLNFPIIRSRALADLVPQRGVWRRLKARCSLGSLYREICRVSRGHQISVLHIGQVFPLGKVALALKQRQNIPYIFYAHGLDITGPQRFRRRLFLLKKIIAGADKIIANSYFTHDELVKLGADPKRILVVYPCPNLSGESVPDDLLAAFLAGHALTDKKILLTVGRLVKRKGHDAVIKALPAVIKRVPDVFYAIVGSGPETAALAALVNEKKLGRYVKFFGNVPAQDLPFFYQACRAFIMPARRLSDGDVEGFGTVYLEANAYGKPVIGGKSGGVPEAVLDGRTGLLVNPEKIEEIANAAVKLLNDSAYAQRLGLQGMDRVLEEFNWQLQADKIKAISICQKSAS